MSNNTIELRIDNARIAFAHGLFKASAFEEGQQLKYGADFIVSPDSKVLKQDAAGKFSVATTLKEAQLEVCTLAFNNNAAKGKSFFEDLEAKQKAVRDGNKRKNGSGEIYAGYEGNVYVTSKNASRPSTLGVGLAPVTAEDGVIYSGCYVHVRLSLYVNTDPKRKGLFSGLRTVVFAKDGDAFGGGGTAKAEDFEGATQGATASDFA